MLLIVLGLWTNESEYDTNYVQVLDYAQFYNGKLKILTKNEATILVTHFVPTTLSTFISHALKLSNVIYSHGESIINSSHSYQNSLKKIIKY